MKNGFLAGLGTAVAVAGLALAAAPASPASQHLSHHTPAGANHSWGDYQRGSGPATDLSLIDVVAAGGHPFKPLLITSLYLRPGQSKTAAADVVDHHHCHARRAASMS